MCVLICNKNNYDWLCVHTRSSVMVRLGPTLFFLSVYIHPFHMSKHSPMYSMTKFVCTLVCKYISLHVCMNTAVLFSQIECAPAKHDNLRAGRYLLTTHSLFLHLKTSISSHQTCLDLSWSRLCMISQTWKGTHRRKEMEIINYLLVCCRKLLYRHFYAEKHDFAYVCMCATDILCMHTCTTIHSTHTQYWLASITSCTVYTYTIHRTHVKYIAEHGWHQLLLSKLILQPSMMW